jgi:Sec-independent protein translocase protein TatA
MFNLDPAKLLVIAIVGIILLGPDKLPNVAKQAGAAWRSFNEFRHRMESEVRNTVPDLPPTSEIARLARSPSALLHHLSTLSDEDGGEAPDGSFQPPDGAAGAGGTGSAGAGAAGTDAAVADGEAAPGVAASVPAPDGGAGPHATDGQAAETPTPVAGLVPPTSPAPISSVTPSTSPEVIAPGDPTLN